MIIPIRCFTCGKVIANKWEQYKIDIKSVDEGGKGMNVNDALDKAGMIRYCCRRMFLGQVDTIDTIIMYNQFDTQQITVRQ